MSKIIVMTSGKGGVGKTTTAAAFASGLALQGHKTVVIDFDVGLRNLDLVMGCERRVVFDFINVINGDAKLNQALIKDKRVENLAILPTSQTRDKDALTREGVERVLDQLKEDFDYIICDSPAGIEKGALMALYFADEAVIVTNPEVSSVRDSDRILGVLQSRSRRAEEGLEPVKEHLLLTRYDAGRVERGEMLKVDDVLEILGIPLLGIVPESQSVLKASNVGIPVILDKDLGGGTGLQRRGQPVPRRNHRAPLHETRAPRLVSAVVVENGMSILDIFWRRSKPTAPAARERLQILLAHERSGTAQPDYLPQLHRDILEVIGRYIEIDQDKISVEFENEGSVSMLEVNVELPSGGLTARPEPKPAKRRPARRTRKRAPAMPKGAAAESA